jgi:transglutaminase-like putative cysteine protease
MLRQALPPLQAFPLEELFLVTTAHRHSWAQFWLPRYGWVDFATTSFAIPPLGFGDPNNRDVVIPLIREDSPLVPIPIFPWKTLLRFICILGVLCIAALYGFRYGRELWYTYSPAVQKFPLSGLIQSSAPPACSRRVFKKIPLRYTSRV